jgi:hypothetical protein
MGVLLEARHAFSSPDDGDAAEGAQLAHGLVAGDDQVGLPGGGLQHAVIRLIGQQRNALGRLDGVSGCCCGGDDRGGVGEDRSQLG